ncbi:MAG: AraC family transcriptional regulator [Cyanobacteria bacterium P01_D01_bin.105]
MALELTWQDAHELWTEAAQEQPMTVSTDGFEIIQATPSAIGHGVSRTLKLQPGVELTIFNCTFHQDLMIRLPEKLHPIQFMTVLSGVVKSTEVSYINADVGLLSGSGMQRSSVSAFSMEQPLAGVDILVEPHVLTQLFGVSDESLPAELRPLLPGSNNWQQVFSPKLTRVMRSVAQQMVRCPFNRATERLYLQGKVCELIALYTEAAANPVTGLPALTLRSDTTERIHYAAEILRSRLEHPPSQVDLAQQVGLGIRTLQKGFKLVFGLTPFAYLTQQRMHLAEQLLRQPNCTVAEVANVVGYTNPARFAAAFKRYFGITPRECLQGKKIL